VRAGLRLQILLLLGGLLLVSFVPLYLAVATYTTVAFKQLRSSHARALGRAVAAHVGDARTARTSQELDALLRSKVASEGVESLLVYTSDGRLVARAGPAHVAGLLGAAANSKREAAFEFQTEQGRKLAVVRPTSDGSVIAVLRVDDQAARAAPLLRLLALYTLLVALALLVLAYFALTHLLVRPLDQLGRAAQSVASGARRFSLPEMRVRELGDLGASLHAMTHKLLSEEDALRRKIDEVEAATAQLKQAQADLLRSERLASVGRLAAGLAHEIGNPISALIGLQDLLLTGELEPSEQRDFLLRMRAETERIHTILRDLLQFARPSALRDREAIEPGDVARAVSDTRALLLPQKKLQDVEVITAVSDALPPVALGREQLVQLLLNLVLNAADAVGSGGHIRISAEARADGVVLTVEDDGPGIDPELRDRLFEPFATTKEPGKGTGLGLAVCRGLVEAVGGSISLDETYVAGARFVLGLPRASPSYASGAPAA
jgi:signal transduction histidine kinase